MMERLRMSKTLAVVDDAALFQYCCLFAETEESVARQVSNEDRISRLEAEISTHDLEGVEFVSAVRAIGDITKAVARAETHIRGCRLAVRAYLVEFGQTPAARSRVKVPEKPAEPDPFDEFDQPVH